METRGQASEVGLDVDGGGLILLGEVNGSGDVLLVGAENANSLDSHDVRWICGWGNGVMDEKRKKKKRRDETKGKKIVTKRQTKERRHFKIASCCATTRLNPLHHLHHSSPVLLRHFSTTTRCARLRMNIHVHRSHLMVSQNN